MKLSQEKTWKIYYEVARLYHNVLFSTLGRKGIEYLENRKIDLQLAKKYNIGFAPYTPNKQFIYDALVKCMKFDVKDLLETGILNINIEDGLVKDSIGTQRIVMPITEKDNVVSFSARTIFESVEPRYKTVKYNKLGIFNSDIIDQSKTIYICEGVLDTISLIQIGFPAIGILGINMFGKEHCSVFNNFNGNIILTLDNDENNSAQQAIERIGNILLDYGKTNVYIKILDRKYDEKKADVNNLLCKHNIYKAALLFSKMEIRKFIPTISNIKLKKINTTRFNTNSISLFSIVSSLVPNIKQDSPHRAKCICPFHDHNDTSPSFVIFLNQDGEKFKCFGCGRGGDALKFIMDYYNMNINEALVKIQEFKE